MAIDLDAIRRRHGDLMRHYDDGDEAEFSLAAVVAIDDVPALLAEVQRLTAELDETRR